MDPTKIGELLIELGKHNFVLSHSKGTRDWQVQYAPTTYAGLLPIATGKQNELVAVLEKAVEVASVADANRNKGRKR